MLEFLKHSLGLCGEGHPNLLTSLFGGVGLGAFLSYIKFKILQYGNIFKKRS